MKLVVLDKYSEPAEFGMGYFVRVVSNNGERIVSIPKKRFFRASIGGKVEITVQELKNAEKVV